MATYDHPALLLDKAKANLILDHTDDDDLLLGFLRAAGGELVGVVVVGRPVSRVLDDGATLEVTRLCTDGTANVCSFLYSRAAKIASLMGTVKF